MRAQVTVVLHERNGYKVKTVQRRIVSEGFAYMCGRATLQEYNAEQSYYKLPGSAADACVYSDATGQLITKVAG